MPRPWNPGESCPRCGRGERDNYDSRGRPNSAAFFFARGYCYKCYKVQKRWELKFKLKKLEKEAPKGVGEEVNGG